MTSKHSGRPSFRQPIFKKSQKVLASMHSKARPKDKQQANCDSKQIEGTSYIHINKSDFSKEEMIACDIQQEEFLLNLIDCEISQLQQQQKMET